MSMFTDEPGDYAGGAIHDAAGGYATYKWCERQNARHERRLRREALAALVSLDDGAPNG